jgi:hypothetical protein
MLPKGAGSNVPGGTRRPELDSGTQHAYLASFMSLPQRPLFFVIPAKAHSR